MQISTKGRYALRVMIDLALHTEDSYVSLKTIANRQEVSLKYLEAIVSILHKAGFVLSQRGKNGGYKLSNPPSEYTVGAILKLTEGTVAPVACTEETSVTCERSSDCLAFPMWKKLDSIIDGYLESVTIEDLTMQAMQ